MGGPVRPIQQTNMVSPHQPQHIHAAPHRAPQQMQHQQILSMHHMQHSGPPGGNPRQPMLLGVNAQNPNGTCTTGARSSARHREQALNRVQFIERVRIARHNQLAAAITNSSVVKIVQS